MTDPVEARFAAAKAIAHEAGQQALAFFDARDTLVIENKTNPQDMVSLADQQVEKTIRSEITRRFPDDAILGEEGGFTSGSSRFTWVIDPIDGTAPFLAGLQHWCTAIAVVEGDKTVIGVIEQPATSESFTARAGAGAWLNGQPMNVGDHMRIDNCFIGTGYSFRAPRAPFLGFLDALLRSGGMFYRNGSGAVMLASVAAGRLGGYYEPHMNSWDCLAGLLMVEEAGGRTLPFLSLSDGGTVLGCTRGIYDGLSRMLPVVETGSGEV